MFHEIGFWENRLEYVAMQIESRPGLRIEKHVRNTGQADWIISIGF